METLEYNVLKERAYAPSSAILQPSMQEMQAWVAGLHRRRSLSFSPEAAAAYQQREDSFQELEQRYQVQDVWGHNTTPAMQTLECIQKVKQALVEGVAEDTMSGRAFSVLVALSIGGALAIVLVWELYFRPRPGGFPLR